MLQQFGNQFDEIRREMVGSIQGKWVEITIEGRYMGTGCVFKARRRDVDSDASVSIKTTLKSDLAFVAIQEELIMSGQDPLNTLKMRFFSDGRVEIEATYDEVEAAEGTSKPTTPHDKNTSVSVQAANEEKWTVSELSAIVAGAMAESLPPGWVRAWMDVKIVNNHIRASFLWVGRDNGEPMQFQTKKQFAPLNAMDAMRNIMDSDGKDWQSATFVITPDGKCNITFKDANGKQKYKIEYALKL